MINLEMNNIIVYFACIILIFIIGKLFIMPIKKILKLIFNSILGGIIIYLINIVGSTFNFHIGLNIYTALVTGFLGIPGVVLLVFLKLLI